MSLGSIVRGCGTRVAGGIYAEVGLAADGLPVEAFLVDPPQVVDTVALGVAPQGVTLLDVNGTTHVLDWVGSSHYPNVADFVEEVRRFGVSRRLARNLAFERLTSASRLILMHARAHIGAWREYGHDLDCPKALPHHPPQETPEMCAGLWWQDIDPTSTPHAPSDGRRVEVQRPSLAYEARLRPEGVRPRYAPAIFASFPISNLAVIRDRTDPANEKHALERARRAHLPVALEDE